MNQVETAASGVSDAIFCGRECSLEFWSDNWAGETVTLEQSSDATNFYGAKLADGSAAEFTESDAVQVAGGFYYRMNKASTQAVRMREVIGKDRTEG